MTVPAYTEPRTTEILDRIKAVFAAKGFDGASMQDLARAASMSAGNFYRYFPSKSAIIEALIERDIAEINAEFLAIMRADSPRDALRRVILHHMTQSDLDKGPLWAEIEAAASRQADIGVIAARMQDTVKRKLVRIFSGIAGLPEAEAETAFAAHAHLLMILVKGTTSAPGCFATQVPEAAIEDMRALTLRVIDQILDEVAAHAPPVAAPALAFQ